MRIKTYREYTNELEYRSVISRIGLTMIIFIVLLYTLCIGATTLISLICVNLAFPENISYSIIQISYGAMYMLAFMLPVLFYKLLSKNKTYKKINFAFCFNKKSILYIFAALAITRIAAFINSIFMSMIFPNAGVATAPQTYSGLYSLIVNIIIIAIVPAVCEEFLFRGVILNNLLPYGKTTAIIVSSVLFGLMHQNVYQLFYTTIAGIIFAYVYLKTESLYCGMLFHFLNNCTSVISDYILGSFGEKAYYIYNTIEYSIIFVVGIISVILLFRLTNKENVRFENGIYRSTFKESMEYSRNCINEKTALIGFFAPSNAIFVVLSLAIAYIQMVSV